MAHAVAGLQLALTVCQLTMLSSALPVDLHRAGTPGPTIATPVEPMPAAERAQSNGPAFPDVCEPAPTDNPLFTLTTDIRPRGLDGKLVAADAIAI